MNIMNYQMKCGAKLERQQNNGVPESTIFDPLSHPKLSLGGLDLH